MSIHIVEQQARNQQQFSKKSGKNFTARSFSFNLPAYLSAADKQFRILYRNLQQVENTIWEIRLSIRSDLTEAEHSAVWKHFCRAIKREGLEVSGARERDDRSHLHYHLAGYTPLLSIYSYWNITTPDFNSTYRKQRGFIRSCIPEHIRSKCEVHCKPVINLEAYCRYIFKARNTIPDLLGNRVDINATERKLYRYKSKLRKVVTTKGFWKQSKKLLWQEEIDEIKSKIDPTKLEQKELKRRTEHELLQQATAEQIEQATHLHNLCPEIEERTILLNLIGIHPSYQYIVTGTLPPLKTPHNSEANTAILAEDMPEDFEASIRYTFAIDQMQTDCSDFELIEPD